MCFRFLLCLFCLALAGPAQAGYHDAPWRTEVTRTYTVRGESFIDTFRVWIDYGAVDGRTKSRMSWDDTQRTARQICTICTSVRTWGTAEESRAWRARNTGDKFNFRPLSTHVFLIVNIESHGPMPISQRPAWRQRPNDVVEVHLRDGRRLTSYGPLEVQVREASLAMPSSLAEQMCMQNKGMLEGQVLYTPAELEQLWRASQKPRPRDHEDQLNWEFLRAMYGRLTTEATFLVPFETGDSLFRPRDIDGVRLHFLEAWVDLQPSTDLVQRTAP